MHRCERELKTQTLFQCIHLFFCFTRSSRAGAATNCCLQLRRWSKPAADLLVDLAAVEQVEVIHAMADPLPILGKRQLAAGVLVLSERAGQRYEPVAEKAFGEVTGFLRDR